MLLSQLVLGHGLDEGAFSVIVTLAHPHQVLAHLHRVHAVRPHAAEQRQNLGGLVTSRASLLDDRRRLGVALRTLRALCVQGVLAHELAAYLPRRSFVARPERPTDRLDRGVVLRQPLVQQLLVDLQHFRPVWIPRVCAAEGLAGECLLHLRLGRAKVLDRHHVALLLVEDVERIVLGVSL